MLKIREHKLQEYLSEYNEMHQKMIMEFDSKEEALEFCNTIGCENCKSIQEMIEYEDIYGFDYKGKHYRILFDEALDVYASLSCVGIGVSKEKLKEEMDKNCRLQSENNRLNEEINRLKGALNEIKRFINE